MKPTRRLVVGWAVVLGVVLVGAAAVRVVRVSPRGAHQAASLYYCPMHPTYTSSRPGDCPICNMKLAKRETGAASEQRPTSHGQQQTRRANDICYLHNCPMAHQGRPCPMLVVAKAGEQVTCPICGTHITEAVGTSQTKKILYWTDPMLPGYKADKPGKSPMGMDLVPVYAEEGSTPQVGTPDGYATIMVSPQKQQLIGVKSAPAARRHMVKTIRTVGKVVVDETRIVHVHPKVEGWVRELYAKYEGDAVTRGQPLFSFYSPDLIATQQEYLTALKTLREIPGQASSDIRAIAEANVAAARQRLLWWDISDGQISELEERGTPQETLLLSAPIDGIVLTKHVYAGEYMERGGDFYHLADLSSLWVNMELYEYELPLVRLDQEAVVTLPSDPEQRLQGRIVFIAPTVKPDTRTGTARLEVLNPESRLKPGMYATAEIAVDLGERLAIPVEAILDTGARQLLFVDKGQGFFEPRDVTVGVKADGYAEVTAGITEGEQVITSGNFLIDSESRLKGALQGIDGGAHQHGQ